MATLRLEREKLARLEEAAADVSAKDAFAGVQRSLRTFALGQDVAAVSIQRIARGNFGRRQFRLRKEDKALSEEIEKAWVEVFDRCTGESWFYNNATHESSWTPPETMRRRGIKPRAVDQINLPPISPVTNKWQQKEEDEEDHTGDDDECRLTEPIERTNFTLPDGTVSKIQLRMAVRDTLRNRKFDSVSTLTRQKNTFLKFSAASDGQRETVYGDRRRKYMAVASVFKTRNGTKQKASIEPTKTAEDESLLKNLAIRDIPHFQRAPEDDEDEDRERRVCFNCWSSGRKSCSLHAPQNDSSSTSSSILMCQNWDLNAVEKRYRNEEIQERLHMSASSLKYDKQRRGFVATVEAKHPMYREVARIVRELNFTKRRRWHQYVCVKSLVDELRIGNVRSEDETPAAKIIRFKNSMRHGAVVRCYTRTAKSRFPKGPVTGDERMKLGTMLEGKNPFVRIFTSPTPYPVALFLPRHYPLPAPRTIPMPEPDDQNDSSSVDKSTIRFATFSRKSPERNNVGGLPAELTAHQLVQAVVPPQFGNYLVVEKLSVVPDLSPEHVSAIWYNTFKCPPINQTFLYRPLRHALNTRIPPTVAIVAAASILDRHYGGLVNRPEQTGEECDVGFRTSTHAAGFELVLLSSTQSTCFEPGPDVATANMPTATPTTTTRVDGAYPFCEPSTRNNTTLDHYHLCLSEQSSPNQAQIFTILGVQQPGMFMMKCDANGEMDSFAAAIYRSWSFAQADRFEEFYTDDGIPYYYDRTTGETYWERPLSECEKLPVSKGGVRVDRENSTTSAGTFYPVHQVRKLTTQHRETNEELLARRRTVARAIDVARDNGTLPPPCERRQETPERRASSIVPPLIRKPSDSSARRRASTSAAPHQQEQQQRRREESKEEEEIEAVKQAIEEKEPMPPAPPVNEMAASWASSVAAALLPALENSTQPVDLLRLGLGLGMGLGVANNAMFSPPSIGAQQVLSDDEQNVVEPSEVREPGPEDRLPASQVAAAKLARDNALDIGLPIGVPEPTLENPSWESLDHTEEIAMREEALEGKLTSVDQYQGVQRVLSPTPDEEAFVAPPIDDGRRAEEIEITRRVPVVAHPTESSGKNVPKYYETHPVAGEGTAFVRKQGRLSVDNPDSLLRRVVEPLPEGFFGAICATRVGQARCDYLPWIPNLPATKPVGRIKPRSAADDWAVVGFDPWSAGKDPLSSEFVRSLHAKVGEDGTLLENPPNPVDQNSFIDVIDRHGLAAQDAEAAQNSKIAQDFEMVASWARHGKYREIEDAFNQPDWLLPIDYQNNLGNTLLSIAVQNGNKRICKLCLRRGANINLANNSGQTVLHYAYAYGFGELAEYLKSKGANDTLLNADGLTCYEGLSMDELEAL